MEQENLEKWEELNPEVWNPENEGDSIEGILVNKQTGVGQNESNLYTIENVDTRVITSVWGSAVIDSRLVLAKLGEKVRIVYEGKETSKKGRVVKLFKVFRAKRE